MADKKKQKKILLFLLGIFCWLFTVQLNLFRPIIVARQCCWTLFRGWLSNLWIFHAVNWKGWMEADGKQRSNGKQQRWSHFVLLELPVIYFLSSFRKNKQNWKQTKKKKHPNLWRWCSVKVAGPRGPTTPSRCLAVIHYSRRTRRSPEDRINAHSYWQSCE